MHMKCGNCSKEFDRHDVVIAYYCHAKLLIEKEIAELESKAD